MEQEQNRSEAPSAFKLLRARQKGQVARGLDLSFLATMLAFLGYCWVAGRGLFATLSGAMHDAFVSSASMSVDGSTTILLIGQLTGRLARPLGLLLLTTFTVILLFEVLQTGIVFSSEPLRPDFSRLNPAQGFKRIFSLKMLLETAKNLIKLALYSGVAWLFFRSVLQTEIGTVHDAASLVRVGAYAAPRLLALFAAVALAIAIVDQLIARRSFFQRMRMSRRELKREHRDREGEPRLKQKRKQMHAEFVRNSRSMKGVRGADMLLVNPLHVAVALRYDATTMSAPIVTAVGVNQLALRLKRLAFTYGVPVVEDPPLARLLLRMAPIDRPIPFGTFKQVADHYNRLRRQRRTQGE